MNKDIFRGMVQRLMLAFLIVYVILCAAYALWHFASHVLRVMGMM